MLTALTVIHVLLTISLIALVLIQRGKGADMGAAFGSGASSTMFGSQGAASFLTRTTGVIATLFFVTSLSLAYMSGQRTERQSVTELGQAAEAVSVEAEVSTGAAKPDLPELPE